MIYSRTEKNRMTFVSNHNFEKSFKALKYHQKKKLREKKNVCFLWLLFTTMINIHSVIADSKQD